MKDLKVRIISIIVMLIVLVPVIYYGGYLFAAAAGVLSVLAYKEVLDLKKSHKPIPLVASICGLVALLYLVFGSYGKFTFDYAVSFSKVLVPFILILLPTVLYNKEEYLTTDAFYLLGFIYLIGFTFNLLIVMRNINIYLLLYLLAVTIFTDMFAYLIGSLVGKNKLKPKISPNKSWEGTVAGLIGGSTISLIFYHSLINPINFKIVFITLLLSMIGQLGDLFYSKVKRENEIKDFSNFIPGHGGILDRIDSLSFVIIFYVVVIWFL